MADENKLSSEISIDTTNAKANITDLNRKMRVLESGFRASAASMGDWSKTSEGNEARMKSLNEIMGVQKTKIANLTTEYEKIVAEQGANSRAAQDAEVKLNKEKEALGKNEVAASQCAERLSTLGSEAESAGSGVEDVGDKAEDATPKTHRLKDAAGKLGDGLKTGVEAAAKAAAVAIAAVGTAAVTAAKSAFDLAQGAGEMADNLLTTSAQTGVSAEKLQGWSYAARFIDTDVSTMTGSMIRRPRKTVMTSVPTISCRSR
jgi:chromosome segregation ATPase